MKIVFLIIYNCYKFARKKEIILQKCIINFLNIWLFAVCTNQCTLGNVKFEATVNCFAVSIRIGLRARQLLDAKRQPIENRLAKITFWSFSRHVAANMLSYHPFQASLFSLTAVAGGLGAIRHLARISHR